MLFLIRGNDKWPKCFAEELRLRQFIETLKLLGKIILIMMESFRVEICNDSLRMLTLITSLSFTKIESNGIYFFPLIS